MFVAASLYATGVGVLSIMDALIKAVSVRYPTPEIAFARYGFGLLAIALILAVLRPGWPSRQALVVNGLRSVLSAGVVLTFFYALSILPLADTVALSFLSPLFLALFGSWLLGERLTPTIWLALGVGFVGMIAILGGEIGQSHYGDLAIAGALAAAVSAVLYALSMVLLRSRATVDRVPVIVFILNFGSVILLAPLAFYNWKPISSNDLAIFVVIGVFGTVGHLLLASAFTRAEAARLAPLEYTALLWAGAIGFFAFKELPSLPVLAGIVLILASAIISTRR
jgi:S-adenosylmethionine uptake transporter